MGFPEISDFPKSHPGPYERQMGELIAGILRVFSDRVPDRESHDHVLRLALAPDHWSAGHAVFDEIRHRLLRCEHPGAAERLRRLILRPDAGEISAQAWQYHLEEACSQALYNATNPTDPFDPSAPFFIVPHAVGLARALDVPIERVLAR